MCCFMQGKDAMRFCRNTINICMMRLCLSVIMMQVNGRVYDISTCLPGELRESPDGFVVLIIIYNDYLLKRIMQQLRRNECMQLLSCGGFGIQEHDRAL